VRSRVAEPKREALMEVWTYRRCVSRAGISWYLHPGTRKDASVMRTFDPDATWTRLEVK